jgi:hypothetical protein
MASSATGQPEGDRMADGFRVDFDTRALQKVAKKYIRKGGKLRTLLEQAGAHIEKATWRRIQQKKNLDGSAFAKLSPEYKRRKKLNKNKILVYYKTMTETLTYNMVSDDEVRIGFGDEKAKWLIFPGSQREPLGANDADIVEIANIAEDILDLS